MVLLGIVLLGVGAGLLIAEAHLPTYGALGLAGVVALAAGAALAVDGAGGGTLLVVAVVILVALAALALLAVIARATLMVGRSRVKTGVEGLVGHVGVMRSAPAPLGQVFVDGALWRARARASRTISWPGRPGRRRAGQGLDALRAPRRGVGDRPVTAVIVALVIIVALGSPLPAPRCGSCASTSAASSSASAASSAPRARASSCSSRVVDRMVAGRPAHGDDGRPAAGRDHARQRDGQGQRGRLLPRHRPGHAVIEVERLPPRHVADRADDAALRARPGRPRRPAGRARAAQRAPAADHRRADRAVGRQGHDRRDQGRRAPAGHAARDGPPGRGRARAPRQGHPRRGRVPGRRSGSPTRPR